MSSFVFVSRSIDVAGGGGIGAYVTAQARLLGESHDVAVVSTADNAARLDEAFADCPGVDTYTIPSPTPDEVGTYWNELHLWSARVLEFIKQRFVDGGPDYIEFPDYLGEGVATIQARVTGDPLLAETRIGVRTYTTGEICAVLDGHLDNEFSTRITCALERYSLKFADWFVPAGGDLVGTYHRYYGEENVAPAFPVRHPVTFEVSATPPVSDPESDDPLRILYLGRFERRKNVHQLVAALAGRIENDFRLTLAGGDTHTAPLQTSMRETAELIADGDGRIETIGHVPHAEIPDLIARHDVLIVPSLWECWPNVALEAMAGNRPVLATKVGGLVEMVVEGQNGMLCDETNRLALDAFLNRAIEQRAELRRMSAEGRPCARLHELASSDEVVEGYEALVATPGRHTVPRPLAARTIDRPLVSVVIPYFKMHEFVEDTVRSVVDQDYRPIEIVVVNDGSFQPDDEVLDRLVDRYPLRVLTKPNGGLGSARNFGIRQSRGRYVVPLDSDNLISSAFIERAVTLLESRPELGFVTAWTRYIDERGNPHDGSPGYQPIGNSTPAVRDDNVAGDAVAVIPRRIFDEGHWYSEELTSYEDWFFYMRLYDAGILGHAIPERLIDYRIRSDSMLRAIGEVYRGAIYAEMRAIEAEEKIRWVCKSV